MSIFHSRARVEADALPSCGMSTSQVTRLVGANGREVRVLRAWRAEVTAGPDAGKAARVDKLTYRVGTHASNDLVLSDPTVSQQHLELSGEPGGLRVTDLSSTNGTYLELGGSGVRVGEVTLDGAVTLRLGGTTLRLSPTAEEAEGPSSERTRFGQGLGSSVGMRELYDKLEAVAKNDCSVLLQG